MKKAHSLGLLIHLNEISGSYESLRDGFVARFSDEQHFNELAGEEIRRPFWSFYPPY